jgi:hypothetical protein
MPSASGKHRVELPESLWAALDEAARRSHQPTAVLVAKWLWEALEAKARVPGHAAEGLHAPQPYDRGWREYSRPGESPRRGDTQGAATVAGQHE